LVTFPHLKLVEALAVALVAVLAHHLAHLFQVRWQSFSLAQLALAHGRLEARRKPEHLRKSQSLRDSDWVSCVE
jgi:hypothetical protein